MKILCKNMTHAIKASKVLTNSGITAKVEKLTNVPDIVGCVYSVSFEDKYFEKSIALMRSGDVILHKKEKNYYGDEWL